MIAKRINRQPGARDDYAHLGRYIAAAKETGEKLDRLWIVGCDAGTTLADLDTALIEIEATRAFNGKPTDRTYHLVVSFHPGELERLSQSDLEEIERAFAEALGFADHQRVAGTHINTDNGHLHVAYNKIHPVTHRCHTPHRDFFTLSKVAREMEIRFGLKRDNGIEEGKSPLSAKARDVEARTWQQSFEGHLVEHKAEIVAMIGRATDWPALHQGLAEFDAGIRKRGAGLVLHRLDGPGAMKASALDRSCTLKRLEDRLGPYQPPATAKRISPEKDRPSMRQPHRPYLARPLTRHPGTDRLWRRWHQARKSTFLGRHVFNLRSWRDYLMADAHKDPLALAILVTHKELLHLLTDWSGGSRRPAPLPASARRALQSWYEREPWSPPAIAGIRVPAGADRRTAFPLRDSNGHVWAIRAVDGQGRTCTIGDADKPGLAHLHDPAGRLGGTVPHTGPVLLTADPLAATLVHAGGDLPALLVGRDADLPHAAKDLKTRHPAASIAVAAPVPSPAAEQAARTAGGTLIAGAQLRELADRVAARLTRYHTVAVDPDLAHAMGAFVETALTPDQAKQSAKPPKPPGPGQSR